MKTRQGFVSNSSSSSFVVMGLPVEKESITSLSLDELKQIIDINIKPENFTKTICCGKELKSNFCPICGKNIADAQKVFDSEAFYERIVREYPPEKLGFFDTPESGVYYCCSIDGSTLKGVLDETKQFVNAAKMFYKGLPEDETEFLTVLNSKLKIISGEYYC